MSGATSVMPASAVAGQDAGTTVDDVLVVAKEAVPAGCVRRFDSGVGPLAVYNLNGRYYATEDGCTHATASLSEGDLIDDDCIACPVHGGTFHIPSGAPTGFPCDHPLRTYRVEEQGRVIRIRLDQEADTASRPL